MGREINTARIDLAFAGIGENGHLAFNNPPADFEARAPYLVIELDAAWRKQQVREGWSISRGSAESSHKHLDSATSESEGNSVHCSRPPQSAGSPGVFRRADVSDGSGLSSARASERNNFFGWRFRVAIRFRADFKLNVCQVYP